MKILIIGFGHLGKCLSAKFLEKGSQVLVMDIKRTRDPAESNSNFFFFEGDATKNEVLDKLNFNDIQEIFICIKRNEAANLLSSLLLLDRGILNITSAYINDLQARVLKLKGVSVLDTAAETAKMVADYHKISL